jgi:hypothetical protein
LVGQLQALNQQRQSVINQIRQATNRLLGAAGSAVRSGRGRAVSVVAAAGTGLRKRKRRKMSKEARAKIAAAQKARWARYRKEKG